MTNRRLLAHPVTPAQAVDWVRGWFDFPHIVPINPGAEHLTHMRRLLEAVGVGGNLVMDAHLAAIVIEYQAELHSNNADFARFPVSALARPPLKGAFSLFSATGHSQ